jgi:hypothetical protein
MNLCLVPFSCLNMSSSSSNAAMRCFALALTKVGTDPLGAGITGVLVGVRTSAAASNPDMATEVSDIGMEGSKKNRIN